MRSLVLLAMSGCGGGHGAKPPGHEHHGQHGQHEHHGGAQPLGHRFGDADKWAPVFDDPTRDAWQKPDSVVATLALAPGMTVADIGAGTGYFESRLSSAVGPDGKVFAVDVEPDMVRYLGERAAREKLTNVEARLGTPDDPNLPLASVDRILIVDTWHHIPTRNAYAAKLAKALKPGGFIVVVDYTLDSAKGPPREHRLAPMVVVAELAQAGLRGSVLVEDLPDQYIVKGEY